MDRKMEPLTVETTKDGMIRMSQTYYTGEEHTIIIYPEQVDLLYKRLKEAQDKIEKK